MKIGKIEGTEFNSEPRETTMDQTERATAVLLNGSGISENNPNTSSFTESSSSEYLNLGTGITGSIIDEITTTYIPPTISSEIQRKIDEILSQLPQLSDTNNTLRTQCAENTSDLVVPYANMSVSFSLFSSDHFFKQGKAKNRQLI